LGVHVDLDRRGAAELTPELAEAFGVWPLGASLATAAAVRGLRSGRKRTALNEAVHEVRRPLQVLALTPPAAVAREAAAIQGSVTMAAVALERLEREINGEAVASRREMTSARALLESAVERWRGRASRSGGSLALRWEAGEVTIEVDRVAITQALDNLIGNAIEHGGSKVVIAAARGRGSLRIAVVDSGREERRPRRQGSAELVARLTGRRRHGHGLRVVRRAAAAHGGRFRLRAASGGTEAVLELPLAAAGGEGA
jgi:signal transduction histidine kinase